MKKFLAGLFIGIILSCCFFYPLLKIEQQNKFELGSNQGFINGLYHSTFELKKHFGEFPKNTQYKTVYSVKTTDVVVYEIDGIKTLGIYE